MLLHFIFLVKEADREKRQFEFEYVKKMSQFFKIWIKEKFGKDYDIQCDEMIIKPRSILQKLDTPVFYVIINKEEKTSIILFDTL